MKSFNGVFFVLTLLVTSVNCANYEFVEQACDDATTHTDTAQETETDTLVEDDSSPTSADSFGTADTAIDSDITEEVEPEEYSCETVHFADPTLGAHVVALYDTDGDGTLSQTEAEAVTELVIYHHWWNFPDHFNRDFNGIQCLVNLEVLEFEAIGAKDLSPLRGLHSLRVLNAWGNNVEDLAPLEDLTDLEYLNLGYNGRITDLTPLAKLTKLTYLAIYGLFTDLAALGNLENLESLYLGTGNWVQSFVPLEGLKSITVLHLDFTGSAGSGEQEFGYEYLGAQDWPLTPIRKLTTLTELVIGWDGIRSIEFLATLVNLKQFETRGGRITDISVVEGLHKLTRLELGGNYVRKLTPLAGLTSLMQVGLAGNGIYDITPLASLPSLSRLDLRSNSFFDVTPLLSISTLDRLLLLGTPIDCTDEALDQLPVEDIDELCP